MQLRGPRSKGRYASGLMVWACGFVGAAGLGAVRFGGGVLVGGAGGVEEGGGVGNAKSEGRKRWGRKKLGFGKRGGGLEEYGVGDPEELRG